VFACLADRPSERPRQVAGRGVEHHADKQARSGQVVLSSADVEPSTRQIKDSRRPSGGLFLHPGGGDQQLALQLDRSTLIAAAIADQGPKRRTRQRSFGESGGYFVGYR
jgi:hypothetical protein